MTNGEYILPTFAIKSFEIYNFNGIVKTKLNGFPKNAKWIFLTGENGYGKTSLLKAFAFMLWGIPRDKSPLFRDNKGIVQVDEDYKKSEIIVYHNNFTEEKYYQETYGPFRYSFICLCAYGSSRLNMASENSKREDNPFESAIESLFDTQILLRNIEHQLSRWAIKKESKLDSDKEFATKYEKVTAILKELLNLQDITVDFKTDKVLYHEKDASNTQYEPVSFHQLAAGYRSIISMVGDMILRLFETQPNVYDPAGLSGIVIIDELDLHLHPKWQKRLPGLLSKIFPRVQFIASTHSPIPLLGAPEHSVFLKVNRDAEKGITVERLEDMEKQISNLLPNTILSSPIFGMRDIFPVTHDSENGIRTDIQ